MKYHENQVNKNLNRFELIIAVIIFIFSGLVCALIINSGQPIDGWRGILWFLVLALLIAPFAFVLPMTIIIFLYHVLDIRDIYDLGYQDGMDDKK